MMPFAASILAKVTATLALALLGTWLARRNRAASRHVLLVGAFAVLLILPIVSFVAPPISVAVPIAPQEEPAAALAEPIADRSSQSAAAVAAVTVASVPASPRWTWSRPWMRGTSWPPPGRPTSGTPRSRWTPT